MTDNFDSGGDFFYTCESHLADRNFALPLADPATVASALPQAEIDAAVEEHRKRQEKLKIEGRSGQKGEGAQLEKEEPRPSVKLEASSPTLPGPTRFKLHTSFFGMRVRLYHQKELHKDAKIRGMQLDLPSAPISQPINPSQSKAVR